MKTRILCCVLTLITTNAIAQKSFTDWASGTSPQEIGKKVSERFLQSPHGVMVMVLSLIFRTLKFVRGTEH